MPTKAKGDQLVTISEDFTDKAKALTPPDELTDAAKRFNDVNHSELAEVKNVVSAAKAGDVSKFNEATSKINTLDQGQNDAANEIGATDCT